MKICVAIERKYTHFIHSQCLHTTANSDCHSGYPQQQIHTVTIVTHNNKFILSQLLHTTTNSYCYNCYTQQQIHTVTVVTHNNRFILSQWLHTTTDSYCHNVKRFELLILICYKFIKKKISYC